MASSDPEEALAVGDVLKRTRTRRKLDIGTVEQRTKIRTKYLRALENEEWDTLPGPAYAKGFLRTYAQFLGLDGDALVDAYRRSVESSLGPDQPHHFAEPVLERRIRPSEEARGPWAARLSIIVALGAAVVVVLLVVGLIGGSDSGHHHHRGKGHGRHHAKGGGTEAGAGGTSSSNPVPLVLVPHDSMEVCLLPGHGQPFIDSQVLIAGATQGPFEPPAENYRLDLDNGGYVTVLLGGKPHAVRSKHPASFAIDSAGIREIDFKGGNCP